MSKKSIMNSEASEELHTLGGRITMLRENAGYSVAELARIIGVKQTTMTNWSILLQNASR